MTVHARARGLTLRRPIDTDPPSARSSRKPTLPGSIFDEARLRAAMAQGLIDGFPFELPYPFTDERLIAVAMSLGMPRWSAEQMRHHPGLRKAYVGLTLDVELAAKGDKPAKARVDAVRARFEAERRAERIHDIPNHTTGYVEAPGGAVPTQDDPAGLF